MKEGSTALDREQKNAPSFKIGLLLQHVYEHQQRGSMILIWNQHDEIIYLSAPLEEYLNFGRNELLHSKWTDIIDEASIYKIERHFQQKADICYISELTFEHDDKRTDVFFGTVNYFLLEDTYYICELKQHSIVEKLKQCMVDSDKMTLTSQLVASFVHEIRNPLTSLKGFVQLIRSGIAQKEEYYKVINSEIEKLENITNELLQMAKPSQTVKKIEYAKELVDGVVLLLRAQVDMRNMEFKLHVEEKMEIYCNAIELKQALFNLIKNGAEAMDKTGILTVRAYESDEKIKIDITDEGIGISEADVNRLNQPYYTTKSDGTGLGLVITEQIIEGHGGTLKVNSNIDQGTTFTVVLPVPYLMNN